MSDPILPLMEWPEGIAQARVPANDNALRLEALFRPCLGVANDESSPSDGDVWLVGDTPDGAFIEFVENDIALYHVDPDSSIGGWHAWAPVDELPLIVAGVRKVFAAGSANEWIDDPSITGGGGAVSSVNGDTGAVIVPVPIIIACSDETTALTTGTAKATFRVPFAMTLTGVRASLTTAQASGSIFTVDINEGGSSILSTKLTIDNTEKTSTTAATPPVISDTSLADDAEITIDIDQIGTSGATGLKVALIGYPT